MRKPFFFHWVLANTLVVFAIIFIVMAVWYTIKNYSAIPIEDAWHTVEKYMDFSDTGNLNDFWTQQNEHRLVVTRIFYFSALKFFNGNLWWIFVPFYLGIGICCCLYGVAFNRLLLPAMPRAISWIGWSFIFGALFSLLQATDLMDAFPITHFLAVEIFLVFSLFSIAYSEGSVHHWFFFCLSCLFGVVAIGTFASGVLTLPIATFFAIALRQGRYKITVLAMLSVVGILSYFFNYTTPANHGSILTTLIEQPLNLAFYILIYLGAPVGKTIICTLGLFGMDFSFYHPPALSISAGAGILFCIMFFYAIFHVIQYKIRSPWRICLLCIMLYTFLTAVGTAGGRTVFGPAQAMHGRYSTYELHAWVALFCLAMPWFWTPGRKFSRIFRAGSLISLTVFAIGLLQYNFRTFSLQGEYVDPVTRNIGGLAMELGVEDGLRYIHPYAEIYRVAQEARRRGLSFFGHVPYVGLRESIGTPQRNPDKVLPSMIEIEAEFSPRLLWPYMQTRPVTSTSEYVEVKGWIYDFFESRPGDALHIINNDSILVGCVQIGHQLNEIEEVESKPRKKAVAGYILAEEIGNELMAVFKDMGFSFREASHALIVSENVQDIPTTKAYRGHLDAINGTQPTEDSILTTPQLLFSGWIARFPTEPVKVPEFIYVAFVEKITNRVFFIKAKSVDRWDVANALNNNKLLGSGFALRIDLDGLIGDYKIALAVSEGGEMLLCSEVVIPSLTLRLVSQ